MLRYFVVLTLFTVGLEGVPTTRRELKFAGAERTDSDAEDAKVTIDHGPRIKRAGGGAVDFLFGVGGGGGGLGMGPGGDITGLSGLSGGDGKGRKGDTCKACKTAVGLVKFLAANGKSEEELLKLAAGLCFDLKIMTKPLCEGLLKINGPALLHIIKTSDLTSAQLCSFLVKFDCDEETIPEHQWTVPVPSLSDNHISSPMMASDTESKPLKVLHISDTHYDPRYVEGVPDECDDPLCCRSDSSTASASDSSANASLSGAWGGWKCDIPERTLDNLLEHIAEEHKDIDYVIWTGDIPPHDSWSMTREESLEVFERTVAKVLRAFPNVPVYPALGNHEAVPPNLFPPSDVAERWSVDWLYERLEKEWSPWVPENASSTVRRGAFYTALNRPGLRIVSLNTNYCYYGNWWLILNSTDPEKELEWLIDVLTKAEENGEKVHIIGHIPPGHSDCLKTWQTNYYKIVQRFSKTIAGQFFGHTHTDEFELYYDGGNPVGVAYLAPSITTYTYLNPGYRIYYVDGDEGEGSSRTVLDHETWFMDLEEANANGTPTWRKLYSAREAYNMTSLSPIDWHEVYTRLRTDDEAFDLYDRFFWSDSPKRKPCDADCRKERLCQIRSCAQYGAEAEMSDPAPSTTVLPQDNQGEKTDEEISN